MPNLPIISLSVVITIMSCISLNKRNSSTTSQLEKQTNKLNTEIKKTDEDIDNTIQSIQKKKEENKIIIVNNGDNNNDVDVEVTNSVEQESDTSLNLILLTIIFCYVLSYLPPSFFMNKILCIGLSIILAVILVVIFYALIQSYINSKNYPFILVNITFSFFVVVIMLLLLLYIAKDLNTKKNYFNAILDRLFKQNFNFPL